MPLAFRSQRGLPEQRQVPLPVAVMKTGQPVGVAVDDVLGNAGEIESWKSRHVSRHRLGALSRLSGREGNRVGFPVSCGSESELDPVFVQGLAQ
jgi:hypothetical protein